MNIELIKQRVSVQDVCALYGVVINAHGFALCPFHREKTPSLKVYDDGRGWHCFGCGEGGDVIDFVAKLYGLPFREVVAKIEADFGIANDRKRQSRRILDARDLWRKKKEIELQKKEYDDIRDEYYKALDDWIALSRIKCDKPEDLTDFDMEMLARSAEIAEKLEEMEAKLIEYGNSKRACVYGR